MTAFVCQLGHIVDFILFVELQNDVIQFIQSFGWYTVWNTKGKTVDIACEILALPFRSVAQIVPSKTDVKDMGRRVEVTNLQRPEFFAVKQSINEKAVHVQEANNVFQSSHREKHRTLMDKGIIT